MANEPRILPTAAQSDVIRRRIDRALRHALHDLRSNAKLAQMSEDEIGTAAARYCWRWCEGRYPGQFWAGAREDRSPTLFVPGLSPYACGNCRSPWGAHLINKDGDAECPR